MIHKGKTQELYETQRRAMSAWQNREHYRKDTYEDFTDKSKCYSAALFCKDGPRTVHYICICVEQRH